MKTLRTAALFAVCCLLSAVALPQVPTGYVLVSATNTADAGGNVVQNGTIAFQPVSNAGAPISLHVAGGYGAVAVPTAGITIQSQTPGSGYSGSWTCAVNGGTYSTQATCTATVSAGGLVFAITNAGAYTAAPTSITFTGGTYAAGTPASATLGYTLQSASVTSGGSGYVVTAAVFPGCSGVTSSVTVGAGVVTAVSASGGACTQWPTIFIYGQGQAGPAPVQAQVTNGVYSLYLADSVAASPANVCYSVTITDNATGNALLGSGYSCVQPAGSGLAVTGTQPWCVAGSSGAGGSCDWDRYTPNLAPQLVTQAWPTGGLSIGTVTSLATGASATATITGTAPNQTLNLGLPAGPGGNATFSSLVSGQYLKGTSPTVAQGVSTTQAFADIVAPGGIMTGNLYGPNFSDTNTTPWLLDFCCDSWTDTEAGNCTRGAWTLGGSNCWYAIAQHALGATYNNNIAVSGATLPAAFATLLGGSSSPSPPVPAPSPGQLAAPWTAHSAMIAMVGGNDLRRAASGFLNTGFSGQNNPSNGDTITIGTGAVSISAQTAGTGYSGGPWTCTVTGGTYTTQATCSATLSGGGLVYAITSPGLYTVAPTGLSVSGGTAGSGNSVTLSIAPTVLTFSNSSCSGAGSGSNYAWTVCMGASAFYTNANLMALWCPSYTFSGSPATVPYCINGAASNDPVLSQILPYVDQVATVGLFPTHNGVTAGITFALATSDATNIAVFNSPATAAQIQSAAYSQALAFLTLMTTETAAQANGGNASQIWAQNMTNTAGSCSNITVDGNSGIFLLCSGSGTYTTIMNGSAFYPWWIAAQGASGAGSTGSFTVTAQPIGRTGTPFTTGTLSTALAGYGPNTATIYSTALETPGYSGPALITFTYSGGTVEFGGIGSNGNAKSTPDQRAALFQLQGGFPILQPAAFGAWNTGLIQAAQYLNTDDGMPVGFIDASAYNCYLNPTSCGAAGYQHPSLAGGALLANYTIGALSSVAGPVVNQTTRNVQGSQAVFSPGNNVAVVGTNSIGALTSAATTGSGSVVLSNAPTITGGINGLPIDLWNTNNVFVGLSAGLSNLTGTHNTGVGNSALGAISSGTLNVAVGDSSLPNITTASQNDAFGYNAGRYYGNATGNYTGSNGIFIGTSCNAFGATDSGDICIGQAGFLYGNNDATFGAPGQTTAHIQGLNGIYLDGPVTDYGSLTFAPVATPVSPNTNVAYSTATTGGTLAASTTYYYRVSCNNAAGLTLASAEQSITTGSSTSTNTVTVTWNADPGCKSYDVYGRTTGGELLMTPSHLAASVLSFTDNGSVTPSGALPAANTTQAMAQGTVIASSAGLLGSTGDANHSTSFTLSSATSIGSTPLCSTTYCPAGTYKLNAYIDVTTACTTTGAYYVSLIYTDDAGAKTVVVPLQGTGTTTTFGPSAMTSSLALASTSNFAQGMLVLRSTGSVGINYSTTATACGSGGPAAGKVYLDIQPVQ